MRTYKKMQELNTQSTKNASISPTETDRSFPLNQAVEDFVSTHFQAISGCLVVGICGPSGSGKTVMAKEIQRRYGGVLLSQDKYFARQCMPDLVDPKPWDSHGKNYETPKGVNCENLLRDLQTHRQELLQNPKEHLLIVEGHLIFTFPQLVSACDMKIFLSTNKEICQQRRWFRTPRPESIKEEWFAWYEEVIWQQHLKYRPTIINNAEVIL